MILSLFSTLAFAGALDGKTFTATLTDPQKKADPDTLTFAADQFEAAACTKYGFAKSAYTATQAGDAWKVTVDQVSATEGKTHWALTVTGTHIEGSMDWTKTGQAAIHYTVSGDIHK